MKSAHCEIVIPHGPTTARILPMTLLVSPRVHYRHVTKASIRGIERNMQVMIRRDNVTGLTNGFKLRFFGADSVIKFRTYQPTRRCLLLSTGMKGVSVSEDQNVAMCPKL
jgi:hypothetical protein